MTQLTPSWLHLRPTPTAPRLSHDTAPPVPLPFEDEVAVVLVLVTEEPPTPVEELLAPTEPPVELDDADEEDAFVVPLPDVALTVMVPPHAGKRRSRAEA